MYLVSEKYLSLAAFTLAQEDFVAKVQEATCIHVTLLHYTTSWDTDVTHVQVNEL